MHYQVSRNGQLYGPYTLDDLQRYVASGNVLPGDLAKTDAMTEWKTVAEILGTPAAAPAYTPPAAANPAQTTYMPVATPAATYAGQQFEDAPDLHWGLYLLFATITCGLFSKVFTCVQASWLKKVQRNSQALIFFLAAYVVWIIREFRARHVLWTTLNGYRHHHLVAAKHVAGSAILLSLYITLILVSRFVMRSSLQEHFNTVEPVGLSLNPVLTLLFGGVYFQSELNRINAMKRAARLRIS